ncbi:hypothetical protein HK102_001533 [Quaeritorhiza haematococci]|nr:hypothetical protein HK102_001533 [Quaeritorhiza haematococci]
MDLLKLIHMVTPHDIKSWIYQDYGSMSAGTRIRMLNFDHELSAILLEDFYQRVFPDPGNRNRSSIPVGPIPKDAGKVKGKGPQR